ncbi:MAG TPA: peptidylprolyl isomerase [Thermoanaerobaculia bacterium]|nr:peptidylprolyl isomerase [Thermoanaerobaculia bacterium]
MTKQSSLLSPRFLAPRILALGLAVLLTGALACKPAPESEEDATAATTSGEAAPSSPSAASPATPGGTAASAQPAAPGTAPQPGGAQEALSPDKLPAVVAKVNGQEIKKEELLQGLQVAQMQLAQMGRLPQGAPPASFYREVLNNLIAQKLLQQEAKKQGIQADEKEVDQQIAAVKKRFPTEQDFQKALASQGINEASLRKEARENIAFQKYIRTEVLGENPVTEQAARDFYNKNQDKMQQPERVHVRHILVKADANAPAADKAKAREKAEGLLARVKGGEDFAKVAQEASDDKGSGARGGDLSWVTRGQMIPPFENAAFALKNPNELSGIVETSFGYHIIQLLERQAASTVPFEQAKGQIQQMLQQRQMQQQMEAKVNALKAKGKVEVFL